MKIWLVWGALVGLAAAAVGLGRLDVALLLAGVKALLLGATWLELGHAARAHAVLYALVVAGGAAALALLVG